MKRVVKRGSTSRERLLDATSRRFENDKKVLAYIPIDICSYRMLANRPTITPYRYFAAYISIHSIQNDRNSCYFYLNRHMSLSDSRFETFQKRR